MKLQAAFIRLPLRFDAARMAEEIAQFAEREWRPHPQGHPGSSALPLVSAYGDAANSATKGPMRPTPHLRRTPYLRQVLEAMGESVIGRTRLMRIEGNGEARVHVDTNYYWLQRLRVHVPIVTDPDVRFLCGDDSVHMAPGETWVFDTWRSHNVLNPNPTRRVHLVIDTAGSPELWESIEKPAGDPRFVPFDPAREAVVRYESRNQPVVMSPGEQQALLALYRDSLAAEEQAELAQSIGRFTRAWQRLWSEHGEAAPGWPEYATLRDSFDRELSTFTGTAALTNGIDAADALRAMLVHPALNPELAEAVPRPRDLRPSARIERPVFIVSTPRAGSTMLFEALAQSPGVFTIGGESHQVIEGIAELAPAARGFASNRLTADDATPDVVRQLEQRFHAALRDRDGRQAEGAVRMLEKTPKNALRIPFLRAAFPDAFFIYLYRDPRATISSMLDAWRSGRLVTYPDLPGWSGPPWSMLLIPEWQSLAGRSLAEIVATQWATATRMLLDDLEQLPADRWCVAAYDRLVEEPQREIERLCGFVGIPWDRPVDGPLPLSGSTLTPPGPEKLARNRDELAVAEPLVRDVAERARDVFARPPAVRARTSKPADDGAFSSVFTPAFAEILHSARASLIITTYQSGRVVLVRAAGAKSLNTHLRTFESPMGVAAARTRLAIGTRTDIRFFSDNPDLASKIDPPGKHDACFVPRGVHVTGDIRIHEIGFAGGELWAVNTRFSTLCTIDEEHSFVPRWRPPFVTHLAAEDRCHLNGMAIAGDRVRYVTALGATNSDNGWRDGKTTGGIIIDVESGATVVSGLCMPHSPRWYDGKLWFLDSGRGTLSVADPDTGGHEAIVQLPGFTRGLAFAGPFAFIGLSQVRESNIFGGLPLLERVAKRECGVWIVDLRTRNVVAFLRFEGSVQEIFDVQVLHGVRYPELLEMSSPLVATTYVLPPGSLADVAP